MFMKPRRPSRASTSSALGLSLRVSSPGQGCAPRSRTVHRYPTLTETLFFLNGACVSGC